jgi:hypothetical protein
MQKVNPSRMATDHTLIDTCLIRAIRCKDRAFTGVHVGPDVAKHPYIECTIVNLNLVITTMAKEIGVPYEASTSQLANLFSPYGGRLHALGWRRVLVRVIRGTRTYGFSKEA